MGYGGGREAVSVGADWVFEAAARWTSKDNKL